MLNFIRGLLIGAILTLLVGTLYVNPKHEKKGHRQGQIDALTGKIHYELITHDDSTRTWERIE